MTTGHKTSTRKLTHCPGSMVSSPLKLFNDDIDELSIFYCFSVQAHGFRVVALIQLSGLFSDAVNLSFSRVQRPHVFFELCPHFVFLDPPVFLQFLCYLLLLFFLFSCAPSPTGASFSLNEAVWDPDNFCECALCTSHAILSV